VRPSINKEEGPMGLFIAVPVIDGNDDSQLGNDRDFRAKALLDTAKKRAGSRRYLSLADREDLASEALVSIYSSRNPKSLEEEIGLVSFRASKTKPFIEKKARQLGSDVPGETVSSMEFEKRCEADSMIHNAIFNSSSSTESVIVSDFLQRLPKNLCQLAFLLIAGYTTREIASMIGSSATTVQRNITKLRELTSATFAVVDAA
jgi:DNA-directed RNA polymerase specialized sigma24 family protein